MPTLVLASLKLFFTLYLFLLFKTSFNDFAFSLVALTFMTVNSLLYFVTKSISNPLCLW